MKTISLCFVFLIVIFIHPASVQQSQAVDPVFNRLEQIFGVAGKPQPGDVYKFSWPRKDLQITVDGIKVETALAFGSWAAFKKIAGEEVVTMGDLVLRPSETNPVMRELQSGGLQIIAVHNHLMGESPQVMYVHFTGRGSPDQLANALKSSLMKTKTPFQAQVSKGTEQSDKSVQQKFETIQRILGRSGQVTGNVLQISVPRKETIRMDGHEVPSGMGMAMQLNFQSARDRVAATGDFVLTAEEVNPVISVLHSYGIEVTALHNHMLQDDPRLFFMHFWAVGTVDKIAEGLKAALAKTKT